MKIKVYDEFKSFREFINTCKGVWRFLKRNNRTIKNITVYATLCNENNKCEDINLYDEKGNISCKNVGLMIGDFPYIDWKNSNENKKIVVCSEDEMLKQCGYNLNCNMATRHQEEQTELSLFITKLPIAKCNGKTHKPLSIFKTIDSIKRYGYKWEKINKVLDTDKKYSNYFWKPLDTEEIV